jgi:putative transposase
MAKGRVIVPDSAMHVICRGNNKQHIFITDEDKLYYYGLLKRFVNNNYIAIFHYCIMNNHVHLITWINRYANLSKFMLQTNLSYFKYYKRRYGYCGHLWQGRFKSNNIDNDAYLLQCGKYIELNPVRSKMTELPEDYRFSSYRYYAGTLNDPLLTPNPAYLALADSRAKCQNIYANFVIDKRPVFKKENASQAKKITFLK